MKKLTIKEIQNESIKILEVILKIARKNNIQLYPAFGTLLGMVRHEGKFIPWDDDIDVGIKTEDADRFFKILDKNLPDDLSIRTRLDKNASSTSSIVSKDYGYMLINIDFFEIINIKDNKGIRKFAMSMGKRYVRRSTGGGIQAFARFLLSIRSKEHYDKRMYKILDEISSKNQETRSMHFIDDDWHPFKTEDYFDVVPAKFEGLDWVIPKNPENYLKTFYGDWKQIPSDKQKKKDQHYEF